MHIPYLNYHHFIPIGLPWLFFLGKQKCSRHLHSMSMVFLSQWRFKFELLSCKTKIVTFLCKIVLIENSFHNMFLRFFSKQWRNCNFVHFKRNWKIKLNLKTSRLPKPPLIIITDDGRWWNSLIVIIALICTILSLNDCPEMVLRGNKNGSIVW